jgi:hypothetical protein
MAKHPDGAWQWPPWPPFDAEAHCAKCGSENVTTTYYAESWYGLFSGPLSGDPPLRYPMPERLRRECVRCGHWWCESVEGNPQTEAPTGPAMDWEKILKPEEYAELQRKMREEGVSI